MHMITIPAKRGWTNTCDACKKEACKRAVPITSSVRSDILFLRLSPTEREVEQERLWIGEPMVSFNQLLMRHTGKSIEEFSTAFLCRCPLEKAQTKHVRNCADSFVKAFRVSQWKAVVACGTQVLRYTAMRGGSPPPLNTLCGRPVKVREYGSLPFITIPDPTTLLNLTGDPASYFYNPQKELLERRRQMIRALAPIAEILNA